MEAEFFGALVARLSQLLEPKGFRLTRQVHLPKSFGHRMATFEGSAFVIDLDLDGKEHDVRLIRRGREESSGLVGEVLAEGNLGVAATPADHARATAAILDAAASIDGAA